MYFTDTIYILGNSFQLNEHQMAKIKKGEELSVEREKEIQQASAYTVVYVLSCLFLTHGFPFFFFLFMQSVIVFFFFFLLCIIVQVVESVNDLAQIMKDLSALVIDQGTIVDRIDYNIQNVATTVEDGLKQLQKVKTS